MCFLSGDEAYKKNPLALWTVHTSIGTWASPPLSAFRALSVLPLVHGDESCSLRLDSAVERQGVEFPGRSRTLGCTSRRTHTARAASFTTRLRRPRLNQENCNSMHVGALQRWSCCAFGPVPRPCVSRIVTPAMIKCLRTVPAV